MNTILHGHKISKPKKQVPPLILLMTSKIRSGTIDTSICTMLSAIFRLAIHPQRFSRGIISGEHCRWSHKRMLLAWNKSCLNRRIILSKSPVFSTHTSPCSEERWSFYHVDVSRCVLTSLHNLQIHSSLVRECTPYHDWASSTVFRWESLRWDIK